jgi:hypothetical protein
MGWYYEDDGPMPDDFGDLIEKYREVSGDTCYFADWGFTVIDSGLCTTRGRTTRNERPAPPRLGRTA